MKKLFPLFLILFTCFNSYCQKGNLSFSDSALLSPSSDYLIEVRFLAEDFSAHTLNEDLHFYYQAQNTGFLMSHDMNVIGLKNIPNIGLGIEEDMGKHLLINFFNVTGGYGQNTFDFTLSVGAGYSVSLDKKKNLRLRATLNLLYENLDYNLGTYTDTTLLGFVIDGTNIGAYVKNVKYVNSAFGISPGLELFYRSNTFDFFLGASYNYTLFYKEKISFYRTSIALDEGLYDQQGNRVSQGAILPGSYIIQLGIIKEFGL